MRILCFYKSTKSALCMVKMVLIWNACWSQQHCSVHRSAVISSSCCSGSTASLPILMPSTVHCSLLTVLHCIFQSYFNAHQVLHTALHCTLCTVVCSTILMTTNWTTALYSLISMPSTPKIPLQSSCCNGVDNLDIGNHRIIFMLFKTQL